LEGVAAEAEFLGEDAEDEAGVVGEVTLPETTRFGAEAVEPFEAAALDPAGSLTDASGVEVEGGTDAEEDGGGEAWTVGGHEAFLFRGAEADPEEIRLGGGDLGDEVLFLGRGEGAEGRRVGADNADAREAGFEAGLEFLGDAGVPAVEEMGGPGLLAPGEDGLHEVGSVDASHGGMSGEAAQPHHGHAVGGGEEGAVVDEAEGVVGLGFHHAMDAGDADIAAGAGADGIGKGLEGGVEIEGGDADAEDIDARWQLHWGKDARRGALPKSKVR
jgi:hypothetical protein